MWPDLPRHTVGFTCPTNTVACSVKLESVPLNACNHIGKDIIIDFFTEPYHVPLPTQSFRLKTVVGFGKVSSADRPFAKKHLPLEYALAIVRMTGTVSVVPGIMMISSRLEGQVHQEEGEVAVTKTTVPAVQAPITRKCRRACCVECCRRRWPLIAAVEHSRCLR